MKSYLIPLYLFTAIAFIWSFIVLLHSAPKTQWAVPVGVGLSLIGGTAGATATALRAILKRIDDVVSSDVRNSRENPKQNKNR
jgi:hypothetical protein